MTALRFALRSLIRQPGRAVLGILGIAAVGALLFDMLLLSRGLVVSLRDLLDRVGFDVRVAAAEGRPGSGPRIGHVKATMAMLAALPEIGEIVPLRIAEAEIVGKDGRRRDLAFIGADTRGRRPWTVLQGTDPTPPGLDGMPSLLVNRNLARTLTLPIGGELTVRGSCGSDGLAPPPVRFRIVGIGDFVFDEASQMTAAATLDDFVRVCGEEEGKDEADLLLVASRELHEDGSKHGGWKNAPEAAAEAIRAARPDLTAFTNEELVARFQRLEFSYFRQISTVLATITLFFGFLLITVLLTVSVNQRLGEIAALRALGFSERRVVVDVLCQSGLLVGSGGLLALPLGAALAVWLDAILRAMPGIPANLHFFVFEDRALALHIALMTLTAALAALYPMRIVTRLPIAATLRSEVVS